MKKINEMTANIDEVEIFEMPQMKLVGREVRCGGPDFLRNKASELWEIILEDGSFEIIKNLPSIIPGAMMAWTGNYTEEDETYSYIIGKFVPFDTQVPKGFSGRILPETLVAKGIYGQGYSIINTYKSWGYTKNYELFGWNAEVVFEDDPDIHDWEHFCEKKQWTNISPVKKLDN
ncbi:MAG TPA: effector binding domain-containing protein [Mobilitalea sp.]|nr:effector binding domain-containing protein [Mobilitalea sp.]